MIPAAHVKGLSAYVASKAAGIKAIELLAAENPDVFCASVHPGMVETATFVKSGSDATRLPMDKGKFPSPLAPLSLGEGIQYRREAILT